MSVYLGMLGNWERSEIYLRTLARPLVVRYPSQWKYIDTQVHSKPIE